MNTDITVARNSLIKLWTCGNFFAHMYSEKGLNNLVEMTEDLYTPIWVQLKNGDIFCAVPDNLDGGFVAVIGQDFYKKISTYYADWVAWSFIPTKQQADSVKWNDHKANYMFGEEG